MNESEIVNEWLQIAYDDFDAAKYLYEHKYPKPLEIICYHCQQSVEKSLKAYLCAKNSEIKKTHELGLLCRHCMEFDKAFSGFADICEELEIYATGTRYPSRLEIEEQDAVNALQQARLVFDFILQKINQRENRE